MEIDKLNQTRTQVEDAIGGVLKATKQTEETFTEWAKEKIQQLSNIIAQVEREMTSRIPDIIKPLKNFLSREELWKMIKDCCPTLTEGEFNTIYKGI